MRRVGHVVTLGVLRASREDEQRLLVLPAERTADDPAWCGNDAEMFAVASDHLDTRAGGRVEAPLGVNRGAVAAAGGELRELALIGQRPIPLHVERRERRPVGDVERLLIRAEDDAVGGEVLTIASDHALCVRIEQPAHREVHAASAVRGQVIDDAADAVERLTLEAVRQQSPPRRELLDLHVQTALDDEQVALRAHRQRAARVRVRVRHGRLAVRLQLHDSAAVVLRQQQAAVIGADDAVAVVASLLPDERPFPARLDHPGDFRDRIVPDALRLNATPAAPSAGGTTAASGRRRRLARRDQCRVAGIERCLHRRHRRIGGRGWQPWRCGLGDQERRCQHTQPRHQGSAVQLPQHFFGH